MDRVPPQDLEAERGLLGSLLLDCNLIGEAVEVIPKNQLAWFYQPEHRLIYETIVGMFERGEPMDYVLMSDRMRSSGVLSRIGDPNYLITLVEAVPSTANMAWYARIVREKGRLRDALGVGLELISRCYEPTANFAEVGSWATGAILDVSDESSQARAEPIGRLVREVQDDVANERSVESVKTGIPFLDQKIGGLDDGSMIVVGARPSVGKTSLALAMIQSIATRGNIKCGLFSLEMRPKELATRIVGARSRVSPAMIRNPKFLGKEEREAIAQAYSEGHENIIVESSAGMGTAAFISKCQRMKRVAGVRVIFVDYLGLMSDPAGEKEGRTAEVTRISRCIKQTAMSLDIPIVVLAQLNRGPEQGDRQPRLSDLRDSGAIEQDADVVIFLHRDGDRNASTESWAYQKICMQVAKQRNGPVGLRYHAFHKETMTFEEWKDEIHNAARTNLGRADPSEVVYRDEVDQRVLELTEDAPF